MYRFGFLYSCFMAIAGSTLLAELPAEPGKVQLIPALAEVEPTPARTVQTGTTAAHSVPIPANRQLEELKLKQQQLEKLQAEVGALEKSLGVARQYQVECLMAEVDMNKLRKLDPEIQWDHEHLSIVNLLEKPNLQTTISAPHFRAIEQCLSQTGTLKILMNPTLVTATHQTASVHTGGEFPVTIGNRGDAKPDFREFGAKFSAVIEPAANGKVLVQSVPEFSERDFKNAVKVNGTVIPGITSKSIVVNSEMAPGETTIRCLKTSSNDKTPVILLTALTVTAVEPLQPVAASPRLEPIPETSATR